jgi:hypothetical protein
MAREVREEGPNEAAFRTLGAVTAERDLMQREPLVLEISHLLHTDRDWGNVIRTAVEWSEEEKAKGHAGQFTRGTVYYRLGRPCGEGPKLTPLVTAGVLRRAWTNSRGKPYYELGHDPDVILRALTRVAGNAG